MAFGLLVVVVVVVVDVRVVRVARAGGDVHMMRR